MALKVVFMGTPQFAVPTLEKIIQHHNVLAVVTTPDKPAGRGLKLTSSAVKQFAVSHQLPVLQPEKLSDKNFLNQLQSFNADVFVVVAFRMLPESVWNMPPLGTFNLHASLLPKYRGAAPINFAIINGEKETGVTTFKIQKEIDTGKIALQKKITIDEKDTAGTLHDKLMIIGADVMLETLNLLEKNQLELKPQNDSEASYAPKITKEFCKINWNNTAENIYNFIRGLSPYPAAYTYFEINQKKLYCKILWAEKIIDTHSYSIGSILTDNKNYIKVAVMDGFIDIQTIQPEGKKSMSVQEFLRGNKITSKECIIY
jgi:methionyl-tRNA formyltransferase